MKYNIVPETVYKKFLTYTILFFVLNAMKKLVTEYITYNERVCSKVECEHMECVHKGFHKWNNGCNVVCSESNEICQHGRVSA